MTTLTYRFAATLGATWKDGDEIILSRLDHDANVRPSGAGRRSRRRHGAMGRGRPPRGELPVEQYEELLGERTRLVAVSAASNVLGTRPDVAAISDLAHRAGALVYVDGVHAAAHGPVDIAALDADFFATSAYKWCGPHIGAIVAGPALLIDLLPDKLASSPDDVPDPIRDGHRAEDGVVTRDTGHADLAALQRGRARDVRGGEHRRERLLDDREHADDVAALLAGEREVVDVEDRELKLARRAAA